MTGVARGGSSVTIPEGACTQQCGHEGHCTALPGKGILAVTWGRAMPGIGAHLPVFLTALAAETATGAQRGRHPGPLLQPGGDNPCGTHRNSSPRPW